MLLQQLADGALAQTTGVTRVAVSELLGELVTADGNLVGIDDDDEVASINVGRECRLVLAAQQLGCFDGEPAKHHVGGIDDVPRTRGVTRLRRVCRHSAYLSRFGFPRLAAGPASASRCSRRPTLTRDLLTREGSTRQPSSLPPTVDASQNGSSGMDRTLAASAASHVNNSPSQLT